MSVRNEPPVRRRSPSALQALLILGAFLVAMVWLFGGFGNRDPLWFLTVFDEKPSAIRIYRDGATRDVLPGQPGFEELVAAINAEVAQHAGYYEGLAPSGDSLASYVERGFAVEIVYPRPVQVHTRFYFPQANRLLVAIDGSYNYLKVPLLFRASADRWLPGGLALTSVERIRAAVDAVMAEP